MSYSNYYWQKRSVALLSVLALALLLVLSACGDTATSVPATTGAAGATTSAATTTVRLPLRQVAQLPQVPLLLRRLARLQRQRQVLLVASSMVKSNLAHHFPLAASLPTKESTLAAVTNFGRIPIMRRVVSSLVESTTKSSPNIMTMPATSKKAQP